MKIFIHAFTHMYIYIPLYNLYAHQRSCIYARQDGGSLYGCYLFFHFPFLCTRLRYVHITTLSVGSPHFQTWRTAKEKPYHLTRTQFRHGTPRSTIVHRCQMKVKWPRCAKPTAVCGFRVTSVANRVLHIDQSQAARHCNGS